MNRFELPLFPLNVVVFPGMPLPLHIFEERYKQMIGLCLSEGQPFGIVLIRSGAAEYDPAVEPYSVGCMVEIIQVERLEDDRLFIMTVGQERFRILSLKRDRAYLVGVVEVMAMKQELAAPLAQAANRLYPLVIDYLNILSKVAEVEFDTTRVPTDPELLVYTAAALIQTSLEKKQSLLETDRASRLLAHLYDLYEQEIVLLRRIPKGDDGPFSVN